MGVKKSTVCTSARVVIELVHTRIVRGPVVDQDPVVVRHGHVAQHLGELTSGELARSTGAGGVVGQALLHWSVSSRFATSQSVQSFRILPRLRAARKPLSRLLDSPLRQLFDRAAAVRLRS